MKKIAVLFLFLATLRGLYAQETDTLRNARKKAFIISTGYTHLRMLDKQVSPLLYKADIIPLAIGYQVLSHKTYWGVHSNILSYGWLNNVSHDERRYYSLSLDNNGLPTSKTVNAGTSAIYRQEINFWYQKKIAKQQSSKNTLYVGAEFKHYFQLAFAPAADFVMNEIGFNPKITAIREINPSSSFSSSISFPLTGIMVRLPYANDPADGKHGTFLATYLMGAKIFTPFSYQRVNVDLGYSTKISRKWGLGISYHFHWLRYSKNRGVTAYDNQFGLSFIKNIGE